jgi:hypothetical protein
MTSVLNLWGENESASYQIPVEFHVGFLNDICFEFVGRK